MEFFTLGCDFLASYVLIQGLTFGLLPKKGSK